MPDERDRRRIEHRDHAEDRVRQRTAAIPIPLEGAEDSSAFDTTTGVDQMIDRIAARGANIKEPTSSFARDLRLAVEELLEHTAHVEERNKARIRRSTNEILKSHQDMLRGGPPPSPLKRLIGVAKWLGPLLVAIISSIYAFGFRQGLSESEADARAADRREIQQLDVTVRKLELDVSNLRGAARAPWSSP